MLLRFLSVEVVFTIDASESISTVATPFARFWRVPLR